MGNWLAPLLEHGPEQSVGLHHDEKLGPPQAGPPPSNGGMTRSSIHWIKNLLVTSAGFVAMSTILFLLAVGTLVGFALGLCFSWVAILASGTVLAILAAALLQSEGYGPLAGIGIIAACLTVNQIAYLAGVMLKVGGGRNPPPNLRGSIWVR